MGPSFVKFARAAQGMLSAILSYYSLAHAASVYHGGIKIRQYNLDACTIASDAFDTFEKLVELPPTYLMLVVVWISFLILQKTIERLSLGRVRDG